MMGKTDTAFIIPYRSQTDLHFLLGLADAQENRERGKERERGDPF